METFNAYSYAHSTEEELYMQRLLPKPCTRLVAQESDSIVSEWMTVSPTEYVIPGLASMPNSPTSKRTLAWNRDEIRTFERHVCCAQDPLPEVAKAVRGMAQVCTIAAMAHRGVGSHPDKRLLQLLEAVELMEG